MSITFDAAPLTEVSLGRTFILRPDFLVPHFGDFWSGLRSEFPRVEHAPPIVTTGDGADPIDSGPFWLPRVWMISADSTRLIQLQQNRFHYNWRQTAEASEYVRFGAIKAAALRVWEQLDDYVKRELQQPLVPLSNELTYTNLIDGEDGESAFDLARRTLRDVYWDDTVRSLSPPRQISSSASFPLPQAYGEMTVVVASGRRPNGRMVVKLDLTIRGTGAAATDFSDWSQVAHDFLIASFKDLTTPALHSTWRLREDANE